MEGTRCRRGPPRKGSDTRGLSMPRAHGKGRMSLKGASFTKSNGKKKADSVSDIGVGMGRPAHPLLGDRKRGREGGEEEELRRRQREVKSRGWWVRT